MGNPADINLKARTVRKKLGITNQKKEVTATPQQQKIK